MDRNFYDNDDFEVFLKQKSDQYKMYPSDRVWNNVYSSLHGRKKWWVLGFALFFISAGLLGGKQLLLSHYGNMASRLDTTTETLSTVTSLAPETSITIARNTPVTYIEIKSTAVTYKKNNTSFADNQAVVSSIDGGSNTTPAITESKSINEPAGTSAETALLIENNLLPGTQDNKDQQISVAVSGKKLVQPESATQKDNSIRKAIVSPNNQLPDAAAVTIIKPYRWSLQFYASPTISYRRLSAISQGENNTVPVATGYATNINQYVNHKPASGFEIGSNVQYKLSDNLSLFAGVQLNYSRYYIGAYKYRTEKASIALNTPATHDTLSGYTDIRNFSGYAPEQLQNKYLQLSVPVGMEIKLLGNKKLQFSVAGGIQPTILLNSTSYLISTDYKNYIQSPDLARSFNVHTNFEAFVSYKAAGLKWQVGPQFRSQLLSSYSNQYRVREFLTEYGIKFGVSKSF
ncbi:MAG: hypothetical protein ABIQ88_01090 [Chitinophagaceae bacterium]